MATTRAEHLAWCKERALEYAGQGDNAQAMASMTSDLSKHPETEGHSGVELMMMLAIAGQFERPGELRKFIEGFN
jgi:hypothetical protein